MNRHTERGITTRGDAVSEVVMSLAKRRHELGLSQTTVAAHMGTSQSVIARVEAGLVDPKLSTIEKYAAAIGEQLTHHRRKGQ